MEKHLQLSDSTFEEQFTNCTLSPELFSHEAHLRLAWIHITKYGVQKAIENICKQIRHFAAFHGADGKYNETVTVAAVRAVHHFLLLSEADNFSDFIAENSRLKTHFKQLLETHYRIDIFNSEEAKNKFLEPDLLPFDPIV